MQLVLWLVAELIGVDADACRVRFTCTLVSVLVAAADGGARARAALWPCLADGFCIGGSAQLSSFIGAIFIRLTSVSGARSAMLRGGAYSGIDIIGAGILCVGSPAAARCAGIRRALTRVRAR